MNRRSFFARFGTVAVAATVPELPATEPPPALMFGTPYCPDCGYVLYMDRMEPGVTVIRGTCISGCQKVWTVRGQR